MASGDVVADTFSVPGGGNVVVQPGVGVSWLIEAIAMENAAGGENFQLSDGTDFAQIIAISDAKPEAFVNMRIPLTNTQYARFLQSGTSAAFLAGYRGFEL